MIKTDCAGVPVAGANRDHQYPLSQYVLAPDSIRLVISSYAVGLSYFASTIGWYTFPGGPNVYSETSPMNCSIFGGLPCLPFFALRIHASGPSSGIMIHKMR